MREGGGDGGVSRLLWTIHDETIVDFYFSSHVHNPGGQEYRTVLLKQKRFKTGSLMTPVGASAWV